MGDQKNDFIVNSKRRCFICLHKIEPDLKPGGSSSRYGLHCLSRYLNMDLTKVFNQKGFISPDLLAKVERSRLKVELCEECASWTKSFSRLYQQSKKIEMEMDLKLAHIQEKLRETEELGRVWKSEEDNGLIEVVEVLRMEASEKCSDRIQHCMPRVRVPKLSRKEVNAYLRTMSGNKKPTEPINAAGSRLSPDDVKMGIQTEDFALDEDEGNDFYDEVDGNSDEDVVMGGPSTIKQKAKHSAKIDTSEDDDEHCNARVGSGKQSQIIVLPSRSKSAIAERKDTIDPNTGKHRCKLCSKEFGRVAFKYHYESVHLKIRYKCNLCEKQFSIKPNYNKHLRIAHLGVRFECSTCHQQFTANRDLRNHQLKNNHSPNVVVHNQPE